MKRIVMGVALCAALSLAMAESDAAPVITDKSEIQFTGTQMNVPVEGKFTAFSGDIQFDPAKPEASRATLVVKTGSADIGLDDGNLTLQQPEWFSADAFPEARFVSTHFKSLGGDRYEAAGELSIKGVSLPVTVPLSVSQDPDGGLSARGEFSVKRLPFKLGEGDWADTTVVADDVTIRFHIRVAQ